jgi:Notch-like protein
MKDSYGYDGISTKILKQSIPYTISSPLTHICNLMISTGIFPTRLKFTEIKPLYKKGKIANTSNYRPISLLTSFSTIFEKIVYTRLIRHLNHNHISVDEQFGFRTKSSTYLASYKLINYVLMSLNDKILVGDVFCDLQKAFDCVYHDILLSKLNWYGSQVKNINYIPLI